MVFLPACIEPDLYLVWFQEFFEYFESFFGSTLWSAGRAVEFNR